jgi:RimJ/RimL family protein N-acetyltransferase
VRTLEDAHTYITKGPLESYTRNGFGLFTVELKDSATPIGMCGLIKRPTLDDVDIGYAYLPAFWGKGYAVEAAAAMFAYAQTVLALPRIVAIVDPKNASSIRVLEKIGLRFDRMIKLAEDAEEICLYTSDRLL